MVKKAPRRYTKEELDYIRDRPVYLCPNELMFVLPHIRLRYFNLNVSVSGYRILADLHFIMRGSPFSERCFVTCSGELLPFVVWGNSFFKASIQSG